MAKRKTTNSTRVVLLIDDRTVELHLVGGDGTEIDAERFKLEEDADNIDHEKAARDVFDLLYQVAMKSESD